MASGTITGTGTGYVAKITWSSTVNSAKTGSSVTANLYAQNVDNCYFYASLTSNATITINGTSKTGGNGVALSTSANGSKKIFDATVTVSYTGSKSIAISGTIPNSGVYSANYGSIGARSASKTVALDTVGSVPSAPSSVSPSTQTISETATSISVSWSKCSSYNDAGGYYVYVSKNGGSYSLVKTVTSLSTTSYSYSITAGQGNTYVFRVYSYNNIGKSSSYKQSGTVTTNKLNAPTIGTLSVCNPWLDATNNYKYEIPVSGGSQTNGGSFKRYAKITMVDAGGTTHTWSCDDPSSNSNTTVSVPMGQSNITTFLGANRYKASITVTSWIQNSNGSKSSTVTKTGTVDINSDGKAVPNIPTITLSNGISPHGSTCFIIGISSITISGGGSAINRPSSSGATLSYSITTTAGNSASGSSKTFKCDSSGVFTATVTAKDSRGLSSSKSLKYRVQSYNSPTIKISSCNRNDSSPTTVDVNLQTSFSNIYTCSGGVDDESVAINGIYNRSYSLDNGTNWTNVSSDSFSITGIAEDQSKTIMFRVSDNIRSNIFSSVSVKIQTVSKLLSMRKWGIGIQCIPENGYALDVRGKSKISDDLVVGDDIHIQNDKSILAKDTNGAYRTMFTPSNSANNTVIGWGMNSSSSIEKSWFNIYNKSGINMGTSDYPIGAVKINSVDLFQYSTCSVTNNTTNTSDFVGECRMYNILGHKFVVMNIRFTRKVTTTSAYTVYELGTLEDASFNPVRATALSVYSGCSAQVYQAGYVDGNGKICVRQGGATSNPTYWYVSGIWYL